MSKHFNDINKVILTAYAEIINEGRLSKSTIGQLQGLPLEEREYVQHLVSIALSEKYDEEFSKADFLEDDVLGMIDDSPIVEVFYVDDDFYDDFYDDFDDDFDDDFAFDIMVAEYFDDDYDSTEIEDWLYHTQISQQNQNFSEAQIIAETLNMADAYMHRHKNDTYDKNKIVMGLILPGFTITIKKLR